MQQVHKSIQQCCHKMNEEEKKTASHMRTLQIQLGIFTSLLFPIYKSMRKECHTFKSRYLDIFLSSCLVISSSILLVLSIIAFKWSI